MTSNYISKLEKALKDSGMNPLFLSDNNYKNKKIEASKKDIKALRTYLKTKQYLEKNVFPKIEFEFC